MGINSGGKRRVFDDAFRREAVRILASGDRTIRQRADVSVATACSVLGVSVSGFYAWKNRRASPRQQRDMILLAHIRAEFSTSNETLPAHACGTITKWLGNRASPRGATDARERAESAPENAFQKDH